MTSQPARKFKPAGDFLKDERFIEPESGEIRILLDVTELPADLPEWGTVLQFRSVLASNPDGVRVLDDYTAFDELEVVAPVDGIAPPEGC